MFDFAKIDEVRLSEGSHGSPNDGLCFMEMVAWFEGEKHSDEPDCACPVLGAYGIRLNDRMGDEARELLKPLVPLMAGTRDPSSEQKRGEFLAMWAVNRILPLALKDYPEHAKACAEAKTLDAARAAATVATYVANTANAAAYAASATYYAARAADAADYAAGAAGAADAARAARAAGVWPIAIEGLRQAILIGRHDGFSASETLLIERKAKLAELA